MFLPFQRNLLSLIPLFHNWLLFSNLYISLLISLLKSTLHLSAPRCDTHVPRTVDPAFHKGRGTQPPVATWGCMWLRDCRGCAGRRWTGTAYRCRAEGTRRTSPRHRCRRRGDSSLVRRRKLDRGVAPTRSHALLAYSESTRRQRWWSNNPTVNALKDLKRCQEQMFPPWWKKEEKKKHTVIYIWDPVKCNNLTNVRGALEESKSLVTDVFILAAPADALSHISWQKGKTHSPRNNGGRLVARREKT